MSIYNYLNEFDIACAMADGTFSSPQKYMGISLYKMRITGTGVAMRLGSEDKPDEIVMRDPALYLTQSFLDRCQGLPVVWEHPAGKTLNSDEFRDRMIGVIVAPWIDEALQEVWGIAKVYDEDAITLLDNQRMSTSPAVVFNPINDNRTISLSSGEVLLIEGVPALLDHLAVCEAGVWDKSQTPYGVISERAGTAKSDALPDPIATPAGEGAGMGTGGTPTPMIAGNSRLSLENIPRSK
ncbi:hypothetical protein [Caballeronia sordidicola]|uniref:hypothetical protein n=1 Tax=Caballeronia sordidicola TaxID=196367 RepID=UPI00117D389C|nr:hypothetical protein [Caballeronia sordidicola]